jgi:hypothetical protein
VERDLGLRRPNFGIAQSLQDEVDDGFMSTDELLKMWRLHLRLLIVVEKHWEEQAPSTDEEWEDVVE